MPYRKKGCQGEDLRAGQCYNRQNQKYSFPNRKVQLCSFIKSGV
nr:MAG TPA: hypothetical protein [Caudoviricetes sp.]